MDKLKPCIAPACGSENVEYVPAFGVKCKDCGTSVPCTFDDIDELWNTRTTSTAEAAKVRVEWIEQDSGHLTAEILGLRYQVGRENGEFYWQEFSSDDFQEGFRDAIKAAKAAEEDLLDRIRAVQSTGQQTLAGAAELLLGDEKAFRTMATAARRSRAEDDEGQFPALFELLDFSGENKAKTVVDAAIRAALRAIADRG